jgi:hypothetical protein
MRTNRVMRPESLMPMVRAALERGEGPPAVLAWMKANGHILIRPFDDSGLRMVAGRLAESLMPRSDVNTLPLTATFSR